jgi:hypothetical protein
MQISKQVFEPCHSKLIGDHLCYSIAKKKAKTTTKNTILRKQVLLSLSYHIQKPSKHASLVFLIIIKMIYFNGMVR